MITTSKCIKKWVHDSSCSPHEAVCLICEFDPDKVLIRNISNYRDVQFSFNVIEFDNLLKMLCGNALWWTMRNNIFYYVDRTLKNNIQVSKKLLKIINLYASNLMNTDLNKFIERYSYLARTINPQRKECGPSKGKTIQTILKTERDQKWCEMAKEQFQNKPNLTKDAVAEFIYSSLEKTAPEYLKQQNGEQVNIGTIIRSIKKR